MRLFLVGHCSGRNNASPKRFKNAHRRRLKLYVIMIIIYYNDGVRFTFSDGFGGYRSRRQKKKQKNSNRALNTSKTTYGAVAARAGPFLLQRFTINTQYVIYRNVVIARISPNCSTYAHDVCAGDVCSAHNTA